MIAIIHCTRESIQTVVESHENIIRIFVGTFHGFEYIKCVILKFSLKL